MKATTAYNARKLADIPNIGPAMVRDFLALGIETPDDLRDKDPYQLYQRICQISGVRQDPCVLYTYMAAVDFLNGAPARPWWEYTALGKSRYPELYK